MTERTEAWVFRDAGNVYVAAVFVGYNDGRNTVVAGRFAELANRTFVVKLTRIRF